MSPLSQYLPSVKSVELVEAASAHGLYLTDLAIYLPFDYDPTNPAVRLRRLLLAPLLRQLQVRTEIVRRFDQLHSFNNILISMPNPPSVLTECRELKALGKRIIYDIAEDVWMGDIQFELMSMCDTVVSCSTLLSLIVNSRLGKNVAEVIPDVVENGHKLPEHVPADKKELSVVYCGMGGNAYLAKSLAPIVEDLGMNLVIISEWDDADIRWDQHTYCREMCKHDIVICPQDINKHPAKSNVKVTQAMAMGLPVICSPLQAYREVVVSGKNGFVADKPEEWKAALEALRDFETRSRISEAAKESVYAYSEDGVGYRWLELLLQPAPMKVAIINTTLTKKYFTYGDYWTDYFRMAGCQVDVFSYDEVARLPQGYNFYFFVEVRYDPSRIASVYPRILYTQEGQTDDTLREFNITVSPSQDTVTRSNSLGRIGLQIHAPLHYRDWYSPYKPFDKLNLIKKALCYRV